MFTIAEVLKATQGRIIYGEESKVTILGISTDTRSIQKGDLFVALEGDRFDGHLFLNEALERGSCGAVIAVQKHRIPESAEEEQLRRKRVIIGVTSPLRGLQDLAQFHRTRFQCPVIAVTGSNGKTTTKEMIASILSQKMEVLKNEGNFNNQVGLPLTILKLRQKHQAAIVELALSRPGELRRLVEISSPQIGVITNIGPTHLETLGTIQGVAEAKGELVEGLPQKDGIAILNADDPYYDYLRKKSSCSTVSFGLQEGADITATVLDKSDPTSTLFKLNIHPRFLERVSRQNPDQNLEREFQIRLPMLGHHNVMNAASAIAAGLFLGSSIDQIRTALESFEPVKMRSQLMKWGDVSILNDSYNANPASMRAALEVLSSYQTNGERIAILGDMLELGEAEEEAHRQIGGVIARVPKGRLIAVGAMAHWIADAALVGGLKKDRISVVKDSEEATATLRRSVGPEDVVLIKGSRGIHLERVVDALKEEH